MYRYGSQCVPMDSSTERCRSKGIDRMALVGYRESQGCNMERLILKEVGNWEGGTARQDCCDQPKTRPDFKRRLVNTNAKVLFHAAGQFKPCTSHQFRAG
jgi:hypothetical protein